MTAQGLSRDNNSHKKMLISINSKDSETFIALLLPKRTKLKICSNYKYIEIAIEYSSDDALAFVRKKNKQKKRENTRYQYFIFLSGCF